MIMESRTSGQRHKLLLGAVALAITGLVAGPLSAAERDIEDHEITAAIESEMWIDETVPANKINVRTQDAVDNGVVKLEGTVDSYSERMSAEDNAYEGGAKDVKNNLDVQLESYTPYYYGPYSPHTYIP